MNGGTTEVQWRVPLVELEVTDADVDAVTACLESGWLTMGPRIEAFEGEIARRIGRKHAVAVSSGTAALELALRSAGVSPGDEVIVPNLSFVACAHAVVSVGAIPVLCDLESALRPVLSAEDVARRLSDRTTAVLAVHMFGYPADLDGLRRICEPAGVAVIEDAAQAIGATFPDGSAVGSGGVAGCFSFFAKKQVPVGEGGMILCDDDSIAERARLLRSHAMTATTWERHRGHAHGYDVVDIGFNYRMDELHAALGSSRLARLDAEVDSRRRVARAYRERLAGRPDLDVPWAEDEQVDLSSHFAAPVLVTDADTRDRVRLALRDVGIQTTQYPAINGLSQYRSLAEPGELPVSEEVADRHLCLPIFASLDDARVGLVVEELVQTLGT